MDFRARDVLGRLLDCRTAALGGHIARCHHCGDTRPLYNSCRDRHCPQCQHLERAAWVEARLERMLPCRYVHMVFTVPASLRPLAPRQPALLYDAMFDAVRRTLTDLAAERLDARIGATALLHTWNQRLGLHPHVHVLVTAGGLSRDDQRWVPAPHERWLFPHAQLCKRFQLHLLRAMARAHKAGELTAESLDAMGVSADPQRGWRRWLKERYAERWVVHARAPMADPAHVVRYLGHYTHRVAISDHRILAVDAEAGTVTLKTRRGPHTVSGEQFVARFTQHILPKGLRKIRHYGLFAPANVNTRLEVARRLLAAPAPPAEPEPEPEGEERPAWEARASRLLGRDVRRCQRCGHLAVRREAVGPLRVARPRGPP